MSRLGLGGLAIALAASASAMSVTVATSLPSPQPVGTMVLLNASVDQANGTIWYRYRVRELGGNYKMIRDYGPITWINWTASEYDGVYEIEVSARNRQTGDTAVATLPYQMLSQVSVRDAVVNPTSHPLVFLYSANCPDGARMKVQFHIATGGPDQETPYKACRAGRSVNFYLAGLYPSSEYAAHHVIDSGGQSTIGPDILFGTGQAPPVAFTQVVTKAPTMNVSNQVLLGSSLNGAAATDLQGNLIWYSNNGIYVVTRPENGGFFWGTIESQLADVSQQVIRKFDLVGMTVLETNAARVNEQLAAMGRRQISGFHHEVRTLPDGRIAALADVEQILTDVQGPGAIDVIGDMIVVLDSDLNVVWAWDTFDHLDVTRTALMNEKCGAVSACAPFYLAKTANDWTHGNAISETPDGQLLYSSRHQDWLIKIGYDSGAGDGRVIWRLGKDGDFQFNSSDAWPWFSHQHDANYESSDPTKLMVFDDGNTRVASNGGDSRGQVLVLDEKSRTASFALNADLGVFSMAVGSAQELRDGNHHFDAGFVADSNGRAAYSIEVDGSGNIVYAAKANTILYRTFRMTSMYSPN